MFKIHELLSLNLVFDFIITICAKFVHSEPIKRHIILRKGDVSFQIERLLNYRLTSGRKIYWFELTTTAYSVKLFDFAVNMPLCGLY